MAATTSAAARTAAPELVISRVFDAPRTLVFKAWTQPEHLARWWGPKGFTLTACAIDVRPGGAWYRRMRAPDGAEYVKRGVYRQIVAEERLAFTYVDEDADGRRGPETLVTVTFEDLGARTRLILHHTGFDAIASRDGHGGGWNSALERFAEYLAKT
jgi:uncharacterized protein YndB with AHSA1/START domain